MDENMLVEVKLYGTTVKLSEKMMFKTYGELREWLCTLLNFSAVQEEYGMYVKTPSRLKKDLYLKTVCHDNDVFQRPKFVYLMRKNRTTAIQLVYENDTLIAKQSNKCCVIA
jgi:hypothetical protein